MGDRVDAAALRETMTRYREALRAHRDELDSLNVFPVPDGDTGTNLLLTQESVAEALEAVNVAELGPLGVTISRAALTGARGNSGVILSQVLRGLCSRLCRGATAGPQDLIEGLQEAAAQARAAVAKPVEGTMLTVLREAADAAAGALSDGAGCDRVAEAALAAGLAAVERTRDLLPALARADVVDAGAKGVVLLFDALVSALLEVPLRVEVGPGGPVGRGSDLGEPAETRYGFEVMYLVQCDDRAVRPLRDRLNAVGDSVVVVGGGGLYSVHVHTDEPDRAVEVAGDAGSPRDVRIASLERQVARACLAGRARAVRAGEAAPLTGVVAVTPEEGTARLFRSLGAEVVVAERASGADLAAAIVRTEARGVLILPDRSDPQAGALRGIAGADLPVRVLPLGSVVEGLAAAAAVTADAPLEEAADRAEEAAGRVATAEVASPDPEAVVRAIRSLQPAEHELLTLLAGRAVSEGAAARTADAVRDAFPILEVELLRGDQADSAFLIGLE